MRWVFRGWEKRSGSDYESENFHGEGRVEVVAEEDFNIDFGAAANSSTTVGFNL